MLTFSGPLLIHAVVVVVEVEVEVEVGMMKDVFLMPIQLKLASVLGMA